MSLIYICTYVCIYVHGAEQLVCMCMSMYVRTYVCTVGV